LNFSELQRSHFGMRVALLNIEMGAVMFPLRRFSLAFTKSFAFTNAGSLAAVSRLPANANESRLRGQQIER